MKARIVSVHLSLIDDWDPDLSWLDPDAGRYEGCAPDEIAKYLAQDAERVAAYGETWNMVGISAVATLFFSTLENTPAGIQGPEISSPGLWGIESDSGSDYFDEVGTEELDQLRDRLAALGFSSEDITAAFDDVKKDW